MTRFCAQSAFRSYRNVVRSRTTVVVSALALTLLSTTAVSGQMTLNLRPEGESHRPVPGSGPSVDLAEKYQAARERRELLDKTDIVKKILQDPANHKLNQDDIREYRRAAGLNARGEKGLDLNDPGLRKLLKHFLNNEAGSGVLNDRQRKLLQELVKQPHPLPSSGSETPSSDPRPKPSLGTNPPDHEAPDVPVPDIDPSTGTKLPQGLEPGRPDSDLKTNEWSKFMAGMVDRVKQSDTVRKSPAIQDTIRGLQKALQRGDFDLTSPIRRGSNPGGLPKGSFSALPNISNLAKLPFSPTAWTGWHPPLTGMSSWFHQLPAVGLPKWSVPDLGIGSTFASVPHLFPSGVAVPNHMAFPAFDPGLLAFAIPIGLCLVGGWLLWSRFGQRFGRRSPIERGADWTVNPAEVRSAADVVKAFEHLSLSTFGNAARSRNHRRLAHDLGTTAETARSAAGRLAMRYECFRYAPDQPGELSAAVLHDVRNDLTHLLSRREVSAP